MTESVYYGLQKIGPSDSPSLNDYAFSWFNVDAVDRLLYKINSTIFDQLHPVGSPTVSPTVSVSTVTGQLAAGRSIRYKYTLVDVYGNETAASPESTIVTPPPVSAPNPPSIAFDTVSGTLTYGTYFYVFSAYVGSDSKETEAGSPTYVAILGTETTNAVTLTLPTLPSGANGFVVYKKGPGQSVYYYLDTIDMSAPIVPIEYMDDGSVAQNLTRTPSIINSTSSNNSVTISIASGVVPPGYTWKIYRSFTGSDYQGSVLRHVTEETVAGSGIIVPSVIDTGTATTAGSPPTRNLIFGDLQAYLKGGAQVISYNNLDADPLVPPWALTLTGSSTATTGGSVYSLLAAAGTGLAQQSYITDTVDYAFDKVYSVGFKFTATQGPITSGQHIQIMEIGNGYDWKLRLFMYSNSLDGTARYKASVTVDDVERVLNSPLSTMPYANSLQFAKTPILNNVTVIDTVPQYIHCILDLDVESRFITKPAIQIFVNGILALYGDFDTGTALMAATPTVAPANLNYLKVGWLGFVGPQGVTSTQSASIRMLLDYIYSEQYPPFGAEFNQIAEADFSHTQIYKAHRQYEAVTRKYLTTAATRTSTTLTADTVLSGLPVSNQSPFVQFSAMLKIAGATTDDVKIKITLADSVGTPWTSSILEYMITPHDSAQSGTQGKIYIQTDIPILDTLGVATYRLVKIEGYIYNDLVTPFPAANLGTMYLTLFWARNAGSGTVTLAPGSWLKIVDQ